ncbi:ABC transporter ATP-binding protein [Actinomyces oris]|uniref:ABC transporter ATP-binding protein n=1 Tax=Actinomyces oris TaxID=544580 RepID=UPI0022FD49E0|nr:ABC transporter ATP-binding protein [Actinomyces oris]WCA44111.1 ABC transporter ATP-binding protein [Actinomyces oris]
MTIVLDHPSPAPSRSVDSPESPPRASTHRRANTAPVGASKTVSEVAAAPVIVRGVRQSYGGREVLRGVDLVVERGSFHGVIGPNGAGKTTLVEIVQGVRRCEAGSVQLLGQAPLPRDPHLLARVGIQPQATAFFTRATVWEHLSTVASIFGASAARAEQLIELMGLGHVLKSRVEKLSGGERQKLAVASAMVHRPEVLFLDEPTAALDATARHDLVGLLGSVREEERRWSTRLTTWRRLSAYATWSAFSMGVESWPRGRRRRWWRVPAVAHRCCCPVPVASWTWSGDWVRLPVLSWGPMASRPM